MATARSSAVGVVIVAVTGLGVWWVPGFSSFLPLPPLLLGFAVGVVARCSSARPGALVATAVVTTAMVFSIVVVRSSNYGVHGEPLRAVVAFGGLIVIEAALAAGAGASVGRNRRRKHEAAVARGAAP